MDHQDGEMLKSGMTAKQCSACHAQTPHTHTHKYRTGQQEVREEGGRDIKKREKERER